MKMKITFFITVLTLWVWVSAAQTSTEEYTREIETYQQSRNMLMEDVETSPLTEDQRETFDGLRFYDVNEMYRVSGKYIALETPLTQKLETTNDANISVVQVGSIQFSWLGKEYELMVFESKDMPEFKGSDQQLFIPFFDESSNEDSNPGGRYLAVPSVENGASVLLDFNKSINPFHAYNDDYVGVKPPAKNQMSITLAAGERKFQDRIH